MSIIGNPLTVGGTGGAKGLNNCLRFSSPSTFTLEVADHTKHWDGSLKWTDGTNEWTTWDGTTTLSASDGFLALRGTGNTVFSNGINSRWVITGSGVACSGNIETLLNYATVKESGHPTMGEACFYYLFANNTSLVSAPELPATTLSQYCYYRMFGGCSNLASVPELPATELASNCYAYMFAECTSLTAPVDLPATTLRAYCYRSMFHACSSIKLAATQGGEYQTPYRIPPTGTAIESNGSLQNMFSTTGGTWSGTPGANVTYYLA